MGGKRQSNCKRKFKGPGITFYTLPYASASIYVVVNIIFVSNDCKEMRVGQYIEVSMCRLLQYLAIRWKVAVGNLKEKVTSGARPRSIYVQIRRRKEFSSSLPTKRNMIISKNISSFVSSLFSYDQETTNGRVLMMQDSRTGEIVNWKLPFFLTNVIVFHFLVKETGNYPEALDIFLLTSFRPFNFLKSKIFQLGGILIKS